MDLEGKVAIITGGGQGIGERIARVLARNGAKIVVTDVRPETANNVAASLRAEGGDALAIQQDV